MRAPKKSTFENTADTFEKWARDLQAVSDSKAYRGNIGARAAQLREVAHYLECAARLRGHPVPAIQTR
jgi:hypothetical protein